MLNTSMILTLLLSLLGDYPRGATAASVMASAAAVGLGAARRGALGARTMRATADAAAVGPGGGSRVKMS